jgi:hypothetical protein
MASSLGCLVAMTAVVVLPYFVSGATWQFKHLWLVTLLAALGTGVLTRWWFERRYGTRSEIEGGMNPTMGARVGLLVLWLAGRECA